MKSNNAGEFLHAIWLVTRKRGKKMMKENDLMKKRIENISSIQKAAQTHLADIYSEYHQSNREFILNQLMERMKHDSEASMALSTKLADFRQTHAKELIAAAISVPEFITDQIDRHSGCWSDGRVYDAFLWGRYMQGILETFQAVDPGIYGIDEPQIHFCRNEMQVGATHIIFGSWFNEETGKVYLDSFPDSPDLRVDTSIMSWEETFIRFKIPVDTGMIPFHAGGILHIERADGKTASIDVILNPVIVPYHYNGTSSDSGFKISPGFAPFSFHYKKTKLFKSPPLPESFEIIDIPGFTDVPGFGFKIWDIRVVPDYPGVTAEVNASYVAENRMNVSVIVKGSWFWDYKMAYTFYVEVPQGFAVDEKWIKYGY